MTELTLTAPQGTTLGYDILQVFPFTSETKRMGIIVRDKSSGEILFYMKGADVVMANIVQYKDWLQDNVRQTLEMLRNAGIKIWMLTGDKLETATCIAKSSKLVSKTQDIHVFKNVSNRGEAHHELNAFRRKQDTALVIR